MSPSQTSQTSQRAVAGGFRDRLFVSPQKDGSSWILEKKFRWESGRGRTYEVPALFVMDFASIPRVIPTFATGLIATVLMLWLGPVAAWSVAAVVVAWIGLAPIGRHQWAATLHDWLYWSQETTRAEADKVFLDAMRDSSVWLTKRWLLYAFVRVFGSYAWYSNRKMMEHGVARVLDRMPAKWDRLPPQGIEQLLFVLMGRSV